MKFNVTLDRPYDQEIGQTFHSLGVSLLFHDDYLPDYVIVNAQSENTLRDLGFVIDINPTRKGHLLSTPRKQKNPRFPVRVSTKPEIDRSLLSDMGLYGVGTKVAVIDSGCIQEMRDQLDDYINFASGSSDDDNVGHASLVITLIREYAPGARIHLAQVCTRDDDVDEESVVRALKWARSIDGLRVINMSLGFDGQCSGICNLARIVNKMASDGYIITVAAGNNPNHTCKCPACAEGAVTVGALDEDGEHVAHFSSRGHINSNKPDLVAPAHGMEYLRGGFSPYKGTSFAAPLIAGIAAAVQVWLSDTRKFKLYLLQSCTPLADDPSDAQGHGRLDVAKLLEVVTHGEKVNAVDK